MTQASRVPPDLSVHSQLVAGLGVAVRRLREARGWSQEQLAAQADLNRSYVGEIERGEVIVSLVTLDKLARSFGLSVAALVQNGEQATHEWTAQKIKLTAIAC